jgi:hypothetical protein
LSTTAPYRVDRRLSHHLIDDLDLDALERALVLKWHPFVPVERADVNVVSARSVSIKVSPADKLVEWGWSEEEDEEIAAHVATLLHP